MPARNLTPDAVFTNRTYVVDWRLTGTYSASIVSHMNTTQNTIFLGRDNATSNRMVAVDPRTGLVLRDATIAEVESYIARKPFPVAVLVGDVLIDESGYHRAPITEAQAHIDWVF